MRPASFTAYSVMINESNTLMKFMKLFCEMPNGSHDVLHAVLVASGDRAYKPAGHGLETSKTPQSRLTDQV